MRCSTVALACGPAMRYKSEVEPRSGVIVIDEPDDTPVTLDDDELAAVDRGLREAATGQVLDARELVAELRRRG